MSGVKICSFVLFAFSRDIDVLFFEFSLLRSASGFQATDSLY